VYPGWAAFFIGPIGLFGSHFSWLANPCLGMSWLKLRKQKIHTAALWAAVALLFALTFSVQSTIPVGSSGSFPYKAAIGYYVWLASILMVLVPAVLLWSRQPVQPEITDAP
jgi:hypothetical protein